MSRSELDQEAVYTSKCALRDAARSLLPTNTRPATLQSGHTNCLARTVKTGAGFCRICGFPGHHSANIDSATACHSAILSAAGWWEDIKDHLWVLFNQEDAEARDQFMNLLANNEVTAEMARDNAYKPIAGNMEGVCVNRLAHNWLKFSRYYSNLGLKARMILNEQERQYIEDLGFLINNYLLQGRTYQQVAFPSDTNTDE